MAYDKDAANDKFHDPKKMDQAAMQMANALAECVAGDKKLYDAVMHKIHVKFKIFGDVEKIDPKKKKQTDHYLDYALKAAAYSYIQENKHPPETDQERKQLSERILLAMRKIDEIEKREHVQVRN